MKKLETDKCQRWRAMLHSPQTRLLDSASRHLGRVTPGSSQGVWEPAALTTHPGEPEMLLESSPAADCQTLAHTPDPLSVGQ